MNKTAIETYELTRRYGDLAAVDSLSLTVAEGEIFGFLGHNGAGKTTTISVLTTLLLPTAGRAMVCGYDIVKQNREVRQQIGYVPENVRLYNDLTVAENLGFLARLSGVTNVEAHIDEVLELIEHPEWKTLRVGTFSKGMRQRIGIAQALLHQPTVLFLDEPASGLDPEGTRAIGDLILQLNHELGITIFMNTHQLAEVAKLCTSIGIMNHGHLILTDTLANVMSRFPAARSLEEVYLQVERTQMRNHGQAFNGAAHMAGVPIEAGEKVVQQ